MGIDVSSVLKNADFSLTFDEAVDLGSYEDLVGHHPFSSPLRITGKISNSGGIIQLSAHITGTYSGVCDRCLEEFERVVSDTVESYLIPGESDPDDDLSLSVTDGELDLDDLVLGTVVPKLPIKQLCREDCRGLCSRCGKNLNLGDCGCVHKEIDPRLEALKALLE